MDEWCIHSRHVRVSLHYSHPIQVTYRVTRKYPDLSAYYYPNIHACAQLPNAPVCLRWTQNSGELFPPHSPLTYANFFVHGNRYSATQVPTLAKEFFSQRIFFSWIIMWADNFVLNYVGRANVKWKWIFKKRVSYHSNVLKCTPPLFRVGDMWR